MPAVSTKRHVLPPSSISSSTGSRVVPATLSTTTRSSPASLLSRLEDLPTLGRPTQRDAARAALGVGAVRRDLGQHLEHGVEHVAAAAAVQGRDRPRLAEAQAPQRGGVGLAALVVDLVGDEHDGLAGAAQQLDDGLVVVGGADGGVDDEHDDVGEVDGDLGLLGDPEVDAGRVGLPAAGVDDGERGARPTRPRRRRGRG